MGRTISRCSLLAALVAAPLCTPALSQTPAGSPAEPARAARPTLGDQLNALIDGLHGEVGRLLRPGKAEPLSQRLNRGIDGAYDLGGRAAVTLVQGGARLAKDLALDGPTVNPSRVLKPADAAVDASLRLDLLQAWRAARVNDPALRAARASRGSAQERMPQARSQLMPQVQLSATRLNNSVEREGVNSQLQPVTIFDRYPSANSTLSVRQPLLRAQQAIGIQQAGAVLREADSVLAKQEQDFSVRVVLSFLEVLLARDQVVLANAQRTFLETAVQAARQLLARGQGTRTDVDAAQARLDLNRAQSLEAQQQVEFSRRQLQALVDRPFGELSELDPKGLERIALPRESLDDWLNRALRDSPEMQRLLAQRDNLRAELNKARAGHLPTVDLVAQAQRSRSENTISPQSRYTNTTVGLQFSMPLYSGGYVNSVTRQVGAEIERVEEEIRGLRADLSVRVHREFRGISEGLLRIKALEAAVSSSDVALDSARKSVQAGVRTLVDVLNAEQQRQIALRDLAQARYQLLAAVVRLHALAGAAEESTIVLINGALSH